jgi:hypothetical protein
VDLLRPRWNHVICGGTIAGFEALFKCRKCEKAAPAIGAVLPAGVRNEPEYFASHPELIVELLGVSFVAKQHLDLEFRRAKPLIAARLNASKAAIRGPAARGAL